MFVGQSRECLSVVDTKLVIDEVCAAFGQHVKYVVTRLDSSTEERTSVIQTQRNAFTVLMESQRAIDSRPLPSKV